MAAATQRRRRFGSTAAEYVPSEAEGEIWIRRFRDPSTQIRICPTSRVVETGEKAGQTVHGTEAWWSAREHFDDGIGAFPCTEDSDCVGCSDPSPKVQKRTRTYYVNALDSRGELRIYKLGSNLFKLFQGREQRMLAQDPDNLQPLSDRDYIINRMGKGLNTTYDPEAGEKYEVDFPEERFDAEEILAERYDAAEAAYNGEEPPPRAKEAAAEDEDVQDTPTRIQTARTTPKAEPAARAEQNGGLPKQPTDEQIEDAETPAIKKWLDDRNVEYPSRAPRVRLVNMAKEEAAKPPY